MRNLNDYKGYKIVNTVKENGLYSAYKRNNCQTGDSLIETSGTLKELKQKLDNVNLQ